jgi:hypothetical protein
MELTLLDNLCKVAGRNGGTIHQFLSHNRNHKSIESFENSYHKYIDQYGYIFWSRGKFDSLAAENGISINWD